MVSHQLHEFYLSSPMREGVLCWYPFKKDSSVHDMSNGILTDLLRRHCEHVVSDNNDISELYDYIVLIDPQDFSVDALNSLYKKLNPHGRLLLAYENPFALRYWSGKTDPATGVPYSTLISRDKSISKAEMQIRLKQAGFNGQKWYYPLADHWFATEVYSEDYLPNEFLNQRFKPYIAYDENLEFDERDLYREVIRGNAFEFMCSSYLVEARICSEDAICSVDYAAVTAYRDPAKRLATTIYHDGTVQKIPLHPEGLERLRIIQSNHEELANLGLNVLPMQLEDNKLIMKRMELPTLWDYWARKLTDGSFDKNEMFDQFDRIRDDIYAAAVSGKCFWELVPANCFYDEKSDNIIYFDQEYYWENVSPDIAVTRAIWSIRFSSVFRDKTQSLEWLNQLKERYGLIENWSELLELARKKTRIEVFGSEILKLEAETKRTVEFINEKNESIRRQNKFKNVPISIKSLGYRRPIIYGYGKRGKALKNVFINADIEIAAIVDKENSEYSHIDQIPSSLEADVIIISNYDSTEIIECLRPETKLPILILENLI